MEYSKKNAVARMQLSILTLHLFMRFSKSSLGFLLQKYGLKYNSGYCFFTLQKKNNFNPFIVQALPLLKKQKKPNAINNASS